MSTLTAPTRSPDTAGPAEEDVVWAWNPMRLEFDQLRAVRCARDTWEIVAAPRGGAALDPGDLVECELSDGELLVQSRVWRSRLL